MGLALRLYLLASHAIVPLAPAVLRGRLRRGKEDPARWREKLGEATQARPPGRVIWLHAVGLGEVLALRGLIEAMAAEAPDLSFLVTSSARSSAQVMAANLPARTQHQFLPLDSPHYLARFLDHWHPDLSVWAEQDIWPGAVVAAAARGIPLAMVNARMTAASHRKRARMAGLYRDVFARFALIDAQEPATAQRLRDLGGAQVQVSGSLKAAAPPLACDPVHLAAATAALAGRRVWLAASTHPGDEAAAIAAVRALADPARLLILVPRDTRRAGEVAAALTTAGLRFAQRSRGEVPGASDAVWLADSYGELGLWYRLADTALIGGGFDRIGGHNPWEAAHLRAAILHGPDVANFATDYAALHAANAARQVTDDLAQALSDPALPAMADAGFARVQAARGALVPLARQVVALMGTRP